MRILKINTLPETNKNWIDRDRIMLNACFQLLVDFVEKENGLTHCNYESHKETIDVLKDLYDWWKSFNQWENKDSEIEQQKLELLIKHREFLWT